MKHTLFITALLAGILTLSATDTAYAAETRLATLNDAQVRFNNGAVQKIQCYNIDGYNFVRARDITNQLDMAVYAIQNGGTGIMIDPMSPPTSTATPETLTQKTAYVQVEEGILLYDIFFSEAECFLLNGRYYFKLADFEKASDNTLDSFLQIVEGEAKDSSDNSAFPDTFPGISVEWNKDTRVIDINRTEADLQKYFRDIRNGEKTPAVSQETKETETETATESTASTYAARVVELVNEERAKEGLSPLRTDAKATQAAELRAAELPTLFSHTRPDGSSCFTALKDAGASYRAAGENIAMGQRSPEQVVDAWMHSEGHRANILSKQFTAIGVGYCEGNYWTQLFIG